MDNILQGMLANMALEKLAQTKTGQLLTEAIHIVEVARQHIFALYEKQDELGMTGVKAATMITFGILKKIADGKKPADLNADDWKEIASSVSEYAVLADDQRYSIFIFSMYERYIRHSAKIISVVVSEEAVASIISLADELLAKEASLRSGTISEVTYTEDCLWISLDAMIKLLASTISLTGDDRVSEFAQAMACFAFEYGRLKLYSRELALINQFIESQNRLDNELEEKYASYLSDLQKESEQFYMLIDNAFAPNFADAFLHSILLAKSAGVSEQDILTSTEDIDAFFLD